MNNDRTTTVLEVHGCLNMMFVFPQLLIYALVIKFDGNIWLTVGLVQLVLLVFAHMAERLNNEGKRHAS